MSARVFQVFRAWTAPLLAALLVLGALWPTVPHARAAREPDVVIVSETAGIAGISKADLRRCFLGLDVSINGVKLVPFNHPAESETRRRFDEAILDMSPVASQRYWIDSLIRGAGRAPRTVSNTRLLLKVVAKLPGAISYVEASAVEGAPGVRAVAIDGALPNDAAYPLR